MVDKKTFDKLHACISCQGSKTIISCTKIAWLKQFCLKLCGYLHRWRNFYNYLVLVGLFPFSTFSLLSRTISGPNKQVVIYMHGPALLLTIVSCKYNINAIFFILGGGFCWMHFLSLKPRCHKTFPRVWNQLILSQRCKIHEKRRYIHVRELTNSCWNCHIFCPWKVF